MTEVSEKEMVQLYCLTILKHRDISVREKKKKKSSKDGHKKVAFYFVPENKKAKVIL